MKLARNVEIISGIRGFMWIKSQSAVKNAVLRERIKREWKKWNNALQYGEEYGIIIGKRRRFL